MNSDGHSCINKNIEITMSLYASHYEYLTEPGREERLHRIIARYLPKVGPSPPRVLDVGCGIGQVTHWLFEAGYDVLGIDSSIEMQTEAKRRFPEVHFVNGNVKEYIEYKVNYIICFGEVLNYLCSLDDLYIALRCLASNLRDGGRLLAELLDPQDLYDGWADTTRLFNMEDGWHVVFDYANLGENRGQWTSRWLRESNSPVAESHSSTTVLNTWSRTELLAAAKACGFTKAKVLDLARGGPVREGTITQLLIAEKI